MKYYECKNCGCVMELVRCGEDGRRPCGENFRELTPNTTDAAHEKHIPIAEVSDGCIRVTVADVLHPMSPDHYIGWVAIATDGGTQRRPLFPDSEPKVEFAILKGEKLREVFAFCNKHGLWSRKYE